MQTHKWWRMLSTSMLVLMLLGLLVPSPAATQKATPPQPTAASPAMLCEFSAPSGGEVSVLNAVTGVPDYGTMPSPNTLWAVGYASRQAIGAPDIATLTLYFTGQAWKVVPSPNVGTENVLTSVSAYSANDAWAVGYSYDGSAYQPLILHYNGSVWAVWHEPTVGWRAGSSDTRLLGVHVLTAGDTYLERPQPAYTAVAVGYSESMSGPIPLVLYYDGSTWQPMTLPPGMELGRLYAVTGASLDDLWAVGTLLDPEGGEVAYLFHHTAAGWTPIVKGEGTLSSLAVVGDQVFTAGHVHNITGAETLVMAYTKSNGDWTRVKSFSTPDGHNVLTGIMADADQVYAVGYTGNPGDDVTRATLVLQYDGVSFAPLTAPSPDKVSELNAAVAHHGMLWAVGTTGHEAQRRSLILSDNCPVTTSPCTISFSDVPPTNPFYPFVQCLACRGIVSGYSDGTFRWGNEVTRGQLAKIIANAAGMSTTIPVTKQMFEDVPSGNAFWLYVERLAATGAISGYDCGGWGEPCVAPANRPYFRWSANATRGQIAKITAVTAGWNGPIPTTQQTFEDVPPTSPFRTWIEELAGRGIVSGYTCGAAGEPCVPPDNRPYFRWGANATRGQMSKIAANTFYPNCQTISP